MQHVHYHAADPGSEDSPYGWKSRPFSNNDLVEEGLFHPDDILLPFHPLFVVPHGCAHRLRDWAESQADDWAPSSL